MEMAYNTRYLCYMKFAKDRKFKTWEFAPWILGMWTEFKLTHGYKLDEPITEPMSADFDKWLKGKVGLDE